MEEENPMNGNMTNLWNFQHIHQLVLVLYRIARLNLVNYVHHYGRRQHGRKIMHIS